MRYPVIEAKSQRPPLSIVQPAKSVNVEATDALSTLVTRMRTTATQTLRVIWESKSESETLLVSLVPVLVLVLVLVLVPLVLASMELLVLG
jgi:hypothetical protein